MVSPAFFRLWKFSAVKSAVKSMNIFETFFLESKNSAKWMTINEFQAQMSCFSFKTEIEQKKKHKQQQHWTHANSENWRFYWKIAVRGMCFLRLCCYFCKMPTVDDDVGVWYGFVAVIRFSKQNNNMYTCLAYMHERYLHRFQHMGCVLASKNAQVIFNNCKTQREKKHERKKPHTQTHTPLADNLETVPTVEMEQTKMNMCIAYIQAQQQRDWNECERGKKKKRRI